MIDFVISQSFLLFSFDPVESSEPDQTNQKTPKSMQPAKRMQGPPLQAADEVSGPVAQRETWPWHWTITSTSAE